MFTLMRRLRRNLLQNQSFGRYGLYALGEVLLIVMGILAALWIDNWNQERQEVKREQFYLSGLKEEFQASLSKLDTLMAVNRKSYQTAEDLLQRIPGASIGEEAVLSKMLIRALTYEIVYNPNNSLLKELINSGRLETLTHPMLRRHLTSWESFLESVRRQEENLRLQRQHTTDLLRGPEGSIRTIAVYSQVDPELRLNPDDPLYSNLDLLKSREFENNFLLFMLDAKNMETVHYAPLRREITTILGLIEAGLD
ncbi:DUF6090 family protein [Robiginitalea marina]|uniref:DUF6090 family protein n=1 Tax=Robiginitalea marina TaxID=2954105 RepID=A0ABT1AZ00_9FLAO|nr:DUF6090 family protein [Robiginitalea marina]MCO5725269.1 DUF6090 family protein [Robiginitalea marina]